MPIYDCRKDGDREAGSLRFRLPIKILNPADGSRIPNVFFLNTSPATIGRFAAGPDGEPLACNRRKRWVTKPDGSKRIEFYWERLNVWEMRPWIAVAVDTGEVIARSGEPSGEDKEVGSASSSGSIRAAHAGLSTG